MPERVIDEIAGSVVLADKHERGIFEEQTRRAGDREEPERPATEQVGGRAFDRAEPTKGPAYGTGAIARAVGGFTYPVARDDVLACAGDNAFEFRRGRPTTVRQALARIEGESFPTEGDLVDAMTRALDERSGADRRASR